ncbi:MAG TPA: type II toxin-antitoxin system VapC family toxin [Accumulibacter sp.]|uniref:type II toxin-antitoxin system VapC family toxin n=1 Tax=Accumulibacter sp. TaxID=2053492 RepID=UPI002D0BE179|nr:type II toxin-antitoxin system VapC family toxin [Accumulibacter sp.]HMW57398.1 type II toxin-antitoxin system VapC family toxin [Accumulibacter sp.]
MSALIKDETNALYFSPASIWEVAIKNALARADFRVDPHLFRRALLDNGYIELPINSEHTAGVANLPDHHQDPFDRLLIAQATVEGITLLTNDVQVAAYRMSPIRLV